MKSLLTFNTFCTFILSNERKSSEKCQKGHESFVILLMLAQQKERPKAFRKAYQTQFITYAQGAYPFTTPLTVGQTPLQWWMAFKGTEHGGIPVVSPTIFSEYFC